MYIVHTFCCTDYSCASIGLHVLTVYTHKVIYNDLCKEHRSGWLSTRSPLAINGSIVIVLARQNTDKTLYIVQTSVLSLRALLNGVFSY